MKVLNVTRDDYANFSHDNANALRSVGVDCEDVKYIPHVFKYDTESQILSMESIIEKIDSADVIQIMHSEVKMLQICKSLAKKRVIVYHTGTNYRRQNKELNAIFNPHVERSFVALGEFAGLGSTNETYIVGAVDTDKLQCKVQPFGRSVLFSHFPSCETTKGTETVSNIVKFAHFRNRNFKFNCSTAKVSYEEQIKRMKECNVYIEMFAPKQGKLNYGSWGITALEAASLSKIVITNHSTQNIYHKAYGILPVLQIANTETELYNLIEDFANYDLSIIMQKQEETREWVEQYHSYKATGNRIKQLL